MCKASFLLCGLSIILWAPLDAAEAKLVRYEINGQTYAYSTRNHRQTQEARQRIAAAQSAAVAKAQADAERAANPLAGVFGSPTQANAAAAQARAQQVAAQPPRSETFQRQPARSAADVTGSVRSRTERRRAAAETRAERRRARAEASAERARARREARAERRSRQTAEAAAPKLTLVDKSTWAERGVLSEKPAPERFASTEPTRGVPEAAPTPRVATPAPNRVSEPAGPTGGPKPPIRSVSFDLSSGVKTVQMTDGSVHEEPIDSGTLSRLGAEPAGASLTSFVDQVRKPPTPR